MENQLYKEHAPIYFEDIWADKGFRRFQSPCCGLLCGSTTLLAAHMLRSCTIWIRNTIRITHHGIRKRIANARHSFSRYHLANLAMQRQHAVGSECCYCYLDDGAG